MTMPTPGDPVGHALHDALQTLLDGRLLPERAAVDYKEEPGRRTKNGRILDGDTENEEAARFLAAEVACMANSDDGGAIILGVADDGQVIGTQLSREWLHLRLYQLLGRKVNCIITEHQIHDARVLAIRVPESAEPIVYKNKFTWRIKDHCEPATITDWYRHKQIRAGKDWSALPSGVSAAQVRSAALELARKYLFESGDERALDLAHAPDLDLLRRLNVMTAEGDLRNAGVVLFVARDVPALDYVRRPFFGADSEERINEPGKSLLEELDTVFTTARAYNPEKHVDRGLQIARYRSLPQIAVREAIVNGVIHREWLDPAPTFIEHVGDTLRVTSPGGFFGGVTPENIINHPPHSRNPLLSEALAKLRIAERQGIGVDRMYGEMLRLGHRAPEFTEHDGASVLVVLAGENPDEGWMRWLSDIGEKASGDLRILMALRRIATLGWTDADDLEPYLQVTHSEAEQVIDALLSLDLKGKPVVQEVQGVPVGSPTVVSLGADAYSALVNPSAGAPAWIRRAEPAAIAKRYAEHRGRISTTELASIVGGYSSNMGVYLTALEDDGVLKPSRPSRRGPGFHYVYCG
ncbi:ATP-binding protein [Trueperella bialowiezensis]|uniref:Divergent AAA domain n=1 Tax=Trueperella bialowiezensis TaxID=312285 RepID=A0A3S4UZC7_9ACTO|nr:ATP-binding protein [Trueperella bialowiezensis]VEI13519.1 Divergent AAA domain [Trueperella bialowiezensis]